MVAFMIHRSNDFQQRLFEQLGFIENGKDKKLTYKHTSVNKKDKTEISHHNSVHSFSLQRSKYVCIDNDISKKNLLGHNSKQFLTSGKDN